MRLDNEKFGDIDSIGVRMPKELKAKIKESAKQNRHSMNAEIVGRLEASYEVGNGFEGLTPEQAQLIKSMIAQFEQVNPTHSLTYQA